MSPGENIPHSYKRTPIKHLLYAVLVLTLICAPLPTSTALAPAAQAQAVPKTVSLKPAYPGYVLGNCYAYVRYMMPSFPMASEVKANSTPHVGAVAIFNYDGLPHYGLITSLSADGFMLTDSNYGGPGIRTHYIALTDKYIVGFWSN